MHAATRGRRLRGGGPQPLRPLAPTVPLKRALEVDATQPAFQSPGASLLPLLHSRRLPYAPTRGESFGSAGRASGLLSGQEGWKARPELRVSSAVQGTRSLPLSRSLASLLYLNLEGFLRQWEMGRRDESPRPLSWMRDLISHTHQPLRTSQRFLKVGKTGTVAPSERWANGLPKKKVD